MIFPTDSLHLCWQINFSIWVVAFSIRLKGPRYLAAFDLIFKLVLGDSQRCTNCGVSAWTSFYDKYLGSVHLSYGRNVLGRRRSGMQSNNSVDQRKFGYRSSESNLQYILKKVASRKPKFGGQPSLGMNRGENGFKETSRASQWRGTVFRFCMNPSREQWMQFCSAFSWYPLLQKSHKMCSSMVTGIHRKHLKTLVCNLRRKRKHLGMKYDFLPSDVSGNAETHTIEWQSQGCQIWPDQTKLRRRQTFF